MPKLGRAEIVRIKHCLRVQALSGKQMTIAHAAHVLQALSSHGWQVLCTMHSSNRLVQKFPMATATQAGKYCQASPFQQVRTEPKFQEESPASSHLGGNGSCPAQWRNPVRHRAQNAILHSQLSKAKHDFVSFPLQ
eukprot:5516009-Amphidinium_carterae.1